MSTVGDIATPTPCRGRGRPLAAHAGRGRRDRTSGAAGPEGWPAACASDHRPARGATGTPQGAGRVPGLGRGFWVARSDERCRPSATSRRPRPAGGVGVLWPPTPGVVVATGPRARRGRRDGLRLAPPTIGPRGVPPAPRKVRAGDRVGEGVPAGAASCGRGRTGGQTRVHAPGSGRRCRSWRRRRYSCQARNSTTRSSRVSATSMKVTSKLIR